MPIVMRLLPGDIYGPVVVCDHCGQSIETSGNVEWQVDETGSQRNVGAIAFTHKQCCWAFENAHGGRTRWRWMDLRLFAAELGAQYLRSKSL